jgi:hypothetical protein
MSSFVLRVDGYSIFSHKYILFIKKKQEPYIKSVCTEITDDIPPNLELPSLLASNIGNTIETLSSMEDTLKKAREDSDKKSLDEDEDMKRRINLAKLVSAPCLESCCFIKRQRKDVLAISNSTSNFNIGTKRRTASTRSRMMTKMT